MPAMGHSIGWYEGDQLVVETLAYAPGFITTIRRYIPHSAAMRSIERFYLEGDRLALEVTYVDPITLRTPLTFDSALDYRISTSWFMDVPLRMRTTMIDSCPLVRAPEDENAYAPKERSLTGVGGFVCLYRFVELGGEGFFGLD